MNIETSKKIELKSIAELLPYALNSKIHGEKQVKQIAASIKEFGFNSPILISKENSVIAGHGRLEAAKLLGMTIVPCVVLEHLDEIKEKGYRLADNRIAQNSLWDDELLRVDLESINKACNFDINDVLGFNDDEIDRLLNDDFEFNDTSETGEKKDKPLQIVVMFDNEDDQQELFLELKDRGFRIK